MSGLTREEVVRMAREIFGQSAVLPVPELERLVAQAYASGQAAERAKMPPAPLVIEMSDIDKEMLVEAMKRSNPMPPVLVSETPLADEIADAVAAEREACIEDVRTVGGRFAVECEALIHSRGKGEAL